MKKAAYTLLGLLSLNVDAQNYQWAKAISDSGNLSSGIVIAMDDASGNLYAAGSFGGTNVNFNQGGSPVLLSSAGNRDIFLAKYDASGTCLWAKSMGGPAGDLASSISLDAAGNICISGSFSSPSVDFDPGPGTALQSSPSSTNTQNMFFAKYDANGNYLWAKSIDNAFGSTSHIKTDASNNIYITATFTGTNIDFDPGPGTALLSALTATASSVYIAKYDANGNYLWAKVIGSSIGGYISSGNGNALNIDAANNIYITGYIKGPNIDFDPGAGTALLSSSGTLDTDIFFAKYDSNGNYLWAKSVEGASSGGVGYSIITDNYGNLYVGGGFQGSNADFDPGVGTAFLSSTGTFANPFFAKYNAANGNYVWAKAIGGSNSIIYSMALDAAGRVYVSGTFTATNIDFDPGAGTALLSSAGSFDIFFAKYDAGGNYIWAKAIGGTNAEAGGIGMIDAAGNIYMTGWFTSPSVDFDPNAGVAYLNNPGFGYNMFIAKYAPCITQVANPQTLCAGSSYTFNGHSYNAAGTYKDTLITALGCDSIVLTQLSFLQPTITINSNSSIVCPNSTLALSASGANSYTWNTGAQTANLIVSPANTTQYFVSGTDADGCVGTSQTITVTTLPAPVLSVNASNSFTLCSPQQQTLTVSGAYSYVWTWGTTAWATSTFLIVNPMVTTQYTITGTGENGACSSSKVVTLNIGCVGIEELSVESGKLSVYPNPVEEILNVELEMINGEPVEIYVYDVFGNTVIHHSTLLIHNSTALNVQELKSGIYFIKIGNEVRKFIKE